MTTRRHLIVFTRTPRLGGTKRRLAREIGDLPAWRFSRLTLRTLLHRLARDPRWTVWLALTPDAAARGRRGVWPAGCRRLPQGSGDLGARMTRLLRCLPRGPAVIVGSDVPGIEAHHIAAAFRRLEVHDAVFGPAPDGGYWLVGLRRRPLPPGLFRDVRWSTRHALADTIATMPSSRRISLIDELEDVDDAAAYHRWRSSL
jgi:uncharacterized protein